MASLHDLRTASRGSRGAACVRAGARASRSPCCSRLPRRGASSCHEMDRTSYTDPDIVALINERFVPVRVDADDRPDISERYSLGGWPTTAFLTPGGEILAGGTFVPPDRMRDMLVQVADAFSSQPDRAAQVHERPVAAAEPAAQRSGVDGADLCGVRRGCTEDSATSQGSRSPRRFTSPWICSPTRATRHSNGSLSLRWIESAGAGSTTGSTAASSAMRRRATGSSRTSRSSWTSMRRWCGCSSKRARNCRSRGSPSAPPIRSATSRHGSPIRSTEGGSLRNELTIVYYLADTPEDASAQCPRHRWPGRFTPTRMPQWSRRRSIAARVFDDDGLREFAVKSLERMLRVLQARCRRRS